MNLSGIGVDKGIGIDVYRVMPFFLSCQSAFREMQSRFDAAILPFHSDSCMADGRGWGNRRSDRCSTILLDDKRTDP